MASRLSSNDLLALVHCFSLPLASLSDRFALSLIALGANALAGPLKHRLTRRVSTTPLLLRRPPRKQLQHTVRIQMAATLKLNSETRLAAAPQSTADQVGCIGVSGGGGGGEICGRRSCCQRTCPAQLRLARDGSNELDRWRSAQWGHRFEFGAHSAGSGN